MVDINHYQWRRYVHTGRILSFTGLFVFMIDPQKKDPNQFRRTWDKEKYEKLSRERAFQEDEDKCMEATQQPAGTKPWL